MSKNSSDEVLSGHTAKIEGTSLLHFWQWAFSDLSDDDLKGIFAEWMIVKLLDITSARRISWANSDIVTDTDVKIEVKATAYWQSWKLIDGSGKMLSEKDRHTMTPHNKVQFSGLSAQDSQNPRDAASTRAGRTNKSDLYFLAFQKESYPEKWNAMDLRQWEFYILRKEDLKGRRSIKLDQLTSSFGPWDVAQFVLRAKDAIAEVNAAQRAKHPVSPQT